MEKTKPSQFNLWRKPYDVNFVNISVWKWHFRSEGEIMKGPGPGPFGIPITC